MNSQHSLSNKFAVISFFGKQYKVQENDYLLIPKIPHLVGEDILVEGILGYSSNFSEESNYSPIKLTKTLVSLQILSHEVGKKLIHFHKRRRKNSRQKKTHLQQFTKVRVRNVHLN